MQRQKILEKLISSLIEKDYGRELSKGILTFESYGANRGFSLKYYCEFILKFYENPLNNCGVFCMAGVEQLVFLNKRDLITDIMKVVGITYSKPLILLNDTVKNFKIYKHIFVGAIVTESEFNNPNSNNICVNYLVNLKDLKFNNSSITEQAIHETYIEEEHN